MASKLLELAKKHKDNKYLWFGFSSLIILASIWFADPERFLESARSADLLILAPAFFFGLMNFPFWSYVWYRVFRSSGIDVSYFRAIKIFMAGQFMNSITPLGQFGGEPVMAYLVKENSGASYEKAISSVFSADVMNAIPMVTFSIGGALYMIFFESGVLNSAGQRVIQSLYVVLFATIVGGGLVYLLWFEAGTIEEKIVSLLEKISDIIGRGEKTVQKIEGMLEEVEESFRAIGEDPRYLLKTAIVSHVGFLMQVFCFFFIIHSLGYDPDFAPIYLVVVLSGLAAFTPTPGGSGAFEIAMAELSATFFSSLGVTFATGLTIAILYRLTTYWPQIMIGYLALNSLNGEVER
jgi:uncharacterized protein (TIRG00374 family)